MSDHIDMKISGSSTMPGGEYGKVSISGAGKIQGNLKCDSLSCSGSGKVEGDVVTQSAVSYTHLDVYKRQSLGCAESECRPAGKPAGIPASDPSGKSRQHFLFFRRAI